MNDQTPILDPPNRLSEQQRHRVRRFVAGRAHDAADCRLLLDMLGLLDAP